MKFNKKLLLSISVLLFIIVYTLYDPSKSNWFPSCAFHDLTGYYCPGCGSQRAIHSLLNFNITEAFNFNAYVVIFIPYLLLGYFVQIFYSKHRLFPWLRRYLFSYEAMYVIFVMVIAFWIGRNI